jgi:hypothetical protein
LFAPIRGTVYAPLALYMARIDPKNDELGMMENIFRGVRSTTSGGKSAENAADATGAVSPPAQEVGEPGGAAEVKSVSTEDPSSHTDPSATTHQNKPQS